VVAYLVEVKYQYPVGNVQEVGNKISIDYVQTTDRAFHEAIREKLSDGTQREVYYNPNRPTESYLLVSYSKNGRLCLILGSMFLMCSPFVFFLIYVGNLTDSTLLKQL
jgi:hypothetical protein